MITLHLEDTRGRLTNLPLEVATAISGNLTFKVEGAQFSPMVRSGKWDGKLRFFVRPSNIFNAGLTSQILEMLPEGSNVLIVDKRTKSFPLVEVQYGYTLPGSTSKSLRDYQVDAVNSILSRTLPGSETPFQRGVVNIATNGGKTVIAEAIINEVLKYSDGTVLFLTHSKEIGYQTRKSMEADLGIEVGFIGDGKWEPKRVTVALIPTLSRNMNNEKFKELTKNVSAYIADEAHHSSADNWFKVMMEIKSPVCVGLTGTVDENYPITKHKLYSVTGDVSVRITNDFLISEGHSAKPICYFQEVSQPDLRHVKEFPAAYQQGITDNFSRNSLICDIIQEEREAGSNVLVMVEHLEHGHNILEILENYENLGVVAFTHGQKGTKYRSEVLKELARGNVNVLVATAILDEGVDVNNLNAIIYARGGKSFRKVLQSVGRTLRKKADGSEVRVYDFIDRTNDYLLEHTKYRYKTLKNEGFEIYKREE